MSPAELILRIIIALILPPLGIIGLKDVGCGTFLLLSVLTLLFWLPGQIVAIFMILKDYNTSPQHRH